MNIPEDLKARYRWLTNRPIWTETHTPAPYSEEQLIERIASLEQQLAALKKSHAELITLLQEVRQAWPLQSLIRGNPVAAKWAANVDAALQRAREVQK